MFGDRSVPEGCSFFGVLLLLLFYFFNCFPMFLSLFGLFPVSGMKDPNRPRQASCSLVLVLCVPHHHLRHGDMAHSVTRLHEARDRNEKQLKAGESRAGDGRMRHRLSACDLHLARPGCM